MLRKNGFLQQKIESFQEDDVLRKKENKGLLEELNEQRDVIKGLRDTIKNIDERNKERGKSNETATKKSFW